MFFNVYLHSRNIRAPFRFALIGGNLTAQSTRNHRKLEIEFIFQRRCCKLSFLFPPHRQSAPRRACSQAINIVQSTLCKTDTFATWHHVPVLERRVCLTEIQLQLSLSTTDTLGQKKVAVVERFKQESMYHGHPTSIFGKYLFGRRFEN